MSPLQEEDVLEIKLEKSNTAEIPVVAPNILLCNLVTLKLSSIHCEPSHQLCTLASLRQ